MKDILEQEIGFTYGLINEKNNQMLANNKSENDSVIQGNADMLMK